jgi:sulfatase maturation enzyme AslB (radical SAM superfamily)
MAHSGFIDENDGWLVRGWASDESRPNEPVDVVCELSSGWTTTVRADEFRPDLEAQGYGDGRHGFHCVLPVAVLQPGGQTLTARIAGTGFTLHRSPFPVTGGPPVEIVAGDIVNNCNLRCPFCITDYERIKGLRLMTRETLLRSIPLMAAVEDGGFWLSCMHEPTLHPQFSDMVEIIPDNVRHKVSFTTNLCKRVPPETLQRLACSGIHSIRVSLDSMEPARFEAMRKGGRFPLFMEQLERLVGFLRDSPRAPRLDFITVVMRDNAGETAALVRACRRRFGTGRHEVRFMYYTPHIAEWGVSHVLATGEWWPLRERIMAENPDLMLAFGDPPDGVEAQFETRDGVADYEHPETVFGGSDTKPGYIHADPLTSGFAVPDRNFRLRMRWDGLMMAEELPEWEMRTNINDLPDPGGYFTRLRAAACRPDTTALAGWQRFSGEF